MTAAPVITSAASAASTASTMGNAAVHRVGDGNASSGDDAAPVSTDEYTPSGAPVRPVAPPTGDTGALTDTPPSTLAANSPAPVAWPGGASVSTADGSNVFGEDLSGLHQAGGVMWAAQNNGRLWRLIPNGSGGWKPDTVGGWASGKPLRFPSGSGAPDSEGVTLTGSGAAGGVFVSSERNSGSSGTSRLSVLRYDVSGSGTTLTATKEWNLTSDLPSVGSNLGFEGVTWIPDDYLVGAGFADASTGAAYNPGGYGAHTGGVFFLGVEGTGMIYGYVLQDSGAFTRIAAISGGMAGVMELQWEPQGLRLWAVCDNTCNGQHRTLKVDTSGTFAVTAVYNRPTGMPNYNNEGFSLAGADECVNGFKPVYWADDANDGGHALRRGTVTC
ncbi:hypothetical protein ACFQ08_19775 [Streptosporangium algeriense]|uniref:Phytase-like domain-containing protein n=1 Tax=Streptosporangium algeriense TaxID=1682748 RepID=A0ABW3DVR9_9ACTN